jgi:two-component system phosphate regulon response regulator OmpR
MGAGASRGPRRPVTYVMAERVLIIDDDLRLTEMLIEYLRARGIAAETRPDARRGIAALRQGGFDAVVLDVMLPDMDGFEVCRRLRAESELPILMLTARGDPADRIVGLEIGADDYLPKPFDPRELLARLRAVLRRHRGAPTRPAAVLRFGRVEIDPGARVVLVDGEERALTGHQFDILYTLARNAGRVLSREAIMDKVRGDSLDAYDRSIDVHISRIRAVIEKDPSRPRHILTRRGAGYVFARGASDGEEDR